MARKVSGVLAVAGGVVLAASLLGFLGSLAWWLDMLANFKLQFAIVLGVVGIVLMVMGRTAAAAAMLAGALLNAAVIAPLYYRSPADPALDSPQVTLASFNLQLGNRIPGLTWVLQDDPDLVFLFETARVHFDELEEHVPEYDVISGIFDTRDYGATILAREPVEIELLEIARRAGDAVRVELPVGDGIVVVYGIHPPSPINSRDAQLRDELLAEVGRLVAAETEPVIVIGDLNATPWSEGFRLLAGPADLANSQEGFGYAASWPTRLPPVGRIPIDHALHSRDLTVTDRQLGPGTAGSDHRPLRVTLTPAASDDSTGSP
jgi:endonuclease/exonuclease/phosphatase (EEP) superfamily protein YafD